MYFIILLILLPHLSLSTHQSQLNIVEAFALTYLLALKCEETHPQSFSFDKSILALHLWFQCISSSVASVSFYCAILLYLSIFQSRTSAYTCLCISLLIHFINSILISDREVNIICSYPKRTFFAIDFCRTLVLVCELKLRTRPGRNQRNGEWKYS